MSSGVSQVSNLVVGFVCNSLPHAGVSGVDEIPALLLLRYDTLDDLDGKVSVRPCIALSYVSRAVVHDGPFLGIEVGSNRKHFRRAGGLLLQEVVDSVDRTKG